MKAEFNEDGFIHIEAENLAEKYAMRYFLLTYDGSRAGTGIVFHEDERTKDKLAAKGIN